MKQRGFTLIELVVVIIILGILAVTAAPKFISLSRDAHIETLRGMGSAMQSAASLVYSKAIVQGVHTESSSSVDLDGDGSGDVDTRYGYPSDSRSTGITLALDESFEQDWAWSSRLGPQRVVMTSASLSTSGAGEKVNNVPITTGDCYITYFGASAPGQAPTVEYTLTGC